MDGGLRYALPVIFEGELFNIQGGCMQKASNLSGNVQDLNLTHTNSMQKSPYKEDAQVQNSRKYHFLNAKGY